MHTLNLKSAITQSSFSLICRFVVVVLLFAIPVVSQGQSNSQPGLPQNVSATWTGSAVEISWSPVNGADGYSVYKNGRYWDGGPNATFYTDVSVTTGETYSYQVVAWVKTDGSTLYSGKTEPIVVTSELSLPQNLSAEWNGESVEISWTPVAGADGYSVYRNGSYFTGGPGTTSYVDDTVNQGQTYLYDVVAWVGAGSSKVYSGRTEQVSVSTDGDVEPPATELAIPQNLSAEWNGESVEISWSPVVGADGYSVYRDGRYFTGGRGTTFYADDTVIEGQTYQYDVVAWAGTGSNKIYSGRTDQVSVLAGGDTEPPDPPTGDFLTLSDFTGKYSDDPENSEEGFFTSPSSPGDTEQIKMILRQGSNKGVSKTYHLPQSAKEAWSSYCVKLGPNWAATAHSKLPGLTSQVNDGSGGLAGGNGGGWAGLCKSWSARPVIRKPGSGNQYALPVYLYHLDNFDYRYGVAKEGYAGTIYEHPCILDPSNPRIPYVRYGDLVGGRTPAAQVLGDGGWHNVTQYIKLNTLNTNAPNDPDAAIRDGRAELYIDGVLTSELSNLHFTNIPEYHNIAFWLNVYHGGSTRAPVDMDVYIDSINVSEGPVNNTVNACVVDTSLPHPGGITTPQNLMATNVNGGIQLTWSVVEGAKGYSLYRDGGNAKSINGSLNTTYFESSAALQPGTTYRYNIAAKSADGTTLSMFSEDVLVNY